MKGCGEFAVGIFGEFSVSSVYFVVGVCRMVAKGCRLKMKVF